MEILRTPDAAFERLSVILFAADYLEIADLRAPERRLRIHLYSYEKKARAMHRWYCDGMASRAESTLPFT